MESSWRTKWDYCRQLWDLDANFCEPGVGRCGCVEECGDAGGSELYAELENFQEHSKSSFDCWSGAFTAGDDEQGYGQCY